MTKYGLFLVLLLALAASAHAQSNCGKPTQGGRMRGNDAPWINSLLLSYSFSETAAR